MNSRLYHKAPLFIITLSILELISFWKGQGLIGVQNMFFSGFYIVGPVIGGLLGTGVLASLLCARRVIRYVCLGSSLVSSGSLYIPTLAAAAYWKHKHSLIRVGIPLLCMIAFVAHPVGALAYVYSLYWLIPIVLYFVQSESIFLTALGATFVQHAVGSVLWLYMVPTIPAMWHGLMPVVFFERVAYASLMTLCMYGISYVSNSYNIRYRKVMATR